MAAPDLRAGRRRQPSFALANHTADCSENGYHYRQIGYRSDGWDNHRFGIRATFDFHALNLCTNPRPGEGTASVAWVDIQGPGGYDIVQVGFGACGPIAGGGCNNGMQDGYAWGRTSSSPGCAGYMSRAPSGTWLGAWSNGGVFQITEAANGTETLSTPSFTVTLNAATACWTNKYVGLFNESYDYGDALGGSSGIPFTYTNKQFMTAAGGAWLTLPNACNFTSFFLEDVFKCDTQPGALRTWTEH